MAAITSESVMEFACADMPSEMALYDTCLWSHGASPGGEVGRYAALESLAMLDTDPEAPFDRITKTMTQIFKTPVSLITLVADPSRVWFKSKVGPFGTCVDRDGSWCNYILVPATPEILISEDASKDARFAHNPYVAGDPFIKFYAGAPLVGSAGERYGTLCIVDLEQRAFTAENYALLNNFAALAVEEIERNKPLNSAIVNTAKNDVENTRYLDKSLAASRDGIIMLDLRQGNWPIVYANPAFEKSSGLKLDNLADCNFWDLFEQVEPDVDMIALTGRGEGFEISLTCKQSGLVMTLGLLPAISDRLAPSKATGIPSWVPSEDAPKGSRLGMDVDANKVVDIKDRDKDIVPDSKCFWFAMVFESGESGQEPPGTGKLSSSGSTQSGGPRTGTFRTTGSAFGQYTVPASLGQIDFGPLLGSGSFGKVYRGIHNGDVAVAIKVMDCRGRGTGATTKQLEEVQLASTLDHPCVVKTLTHGTSMELADSKPIKVAWIVQELCDLGTLTDAAERGWLRIERQIKAPPHVPTVVSTLRDIADAMSHVHSHSIIHADLTGRNVLLASDSNERGFVAKVCDFGISRMAADAEPIQTESLGTISHMPPELMEHQILTLKADVWAFGVLAWEAFHGKCAYKGRTPPQIVLDVVRGKPLPWPDDTPEGFLALMKRCLKMDSEERPEFATVVSDLDNLT